MKRLLFLLAILFLLNTPSNAFASPILVKGTISDQNNHPIAGSIVVVTDAFGKAVLASKADFSGEYAFSVQAGIYTLTVHAPSGLNVASQTIHNEKISSPATLNFALPVPTASAARKPTSLLRWVPYIIGLILLVVLFSGIYVWKKRNNIQQVLSQASSSH